MTWTAEAAIPTGTAILMARWVDSRPTPMAIGANRAADSAITVNQPTTAVWWARKAARMSSTGSPRMSG